MNSKKSGIILAPEYDNDLFEVLSNTLKSEGAKIFSKDWGVGGSQEVSTWDVKINEETINVEAETYIGLSIRGPNTLIERIAQKVKHQMELLARESAESKVRLTS